MNGTSITVIGCAATTVSYGTTNAGVPYASFRLAASERRYDRQQQCWVDGEPSYFTVWAYRWLADNLVSSVGKGDPLMVSGRMRVREWQRDAQQPRTAVAEIEAAAIGHDLSRGTSAFRRTVRGRPDLVAPAAVREPPEPRRPAGPAEETAAPAARGARGVAADAGVVLGAAGARVAGRAPRAVRGGTAGIPGGAGSGRHASGPAGLLRPLLRLRRRRRPPRGAAQWRAETRESQRRRMVSLG